MRRIAVRAIIIEQDKLLLVKLKSKNGPMSFFCTVGGGLDDGEPILDGLKREVLEETGVKAVIGKLLCIQQYADSNDHIEFFFHVTNTEDFKHIDLSQTSHGEIEIAEVGFYDPRVVEVQPKFLSTVSVGELLESSEVMIFNYL